MGPRSISKEATRMYSTWCCRECRGYWDLIFPPFFRYVWPFVGSDCGGPRGDCGTLACCDTWWCWFGVWEKREVLDVVTDEDEPDRSRKSDTTCVRAGRVVAIQRNVSKPDWERCMAASMIFCRRRSITSIGEARLCDRRCFKREEGFSYV